MRPFSVTHENVSMYWLARRTAASGLGEGKSWEREEFDKAFDRYQLASRKFWKTGMAVAIIIVESERSILTVS